VPAVIGLALDRELNARLASSRRSDPEPREVFGDAGLGCAATLPILQRGHASPTTMNWPAPAMRPLGQRLLRLGRRLGGIRMDTCLEK
jgi:hypothetical protein